MKSPINTACAGSHERPGEPTADITQFDALVAQADMLLADLETRSLGVGMAAGLPFIGLARFELSATNFPMAAGLPDLPASYEAGATQVQELLSAAVEQSPSLESCLHVLRAQGLLHVEEGER